MMFTPATPFLHLSAMAPFSGDGNLYRAFGQVIAASHGAVLLAPVQIVKGDLTAVLDGCPVPWEEVDAVLSAELDDAIPFSLDGAAGYGEALRRMAAITPDKWVAGQISLSPIGGAVWVLRHPCGLRFAATSDVLFCDHEIDRGMFFDTCLKCGAEV